MRVALFGATGGTGRAFTEQAIAAGHEVRALTRSPSILTDRNGLHVEAGDVMDPAATRATVQDADAVLGLPGRTGNNPGNVVTRGTENAVAAMEGIDVGRLVVLTSMGLGASADLVPWCVRNANVTALHDLTINKARQEEIAMGSGLEWTIVRPGGLVDEPGTGDYVAGTDVDASARPIPRADVAEFFLQVLESGSYSKAVPVVSSERPIDAGFLREQVLAVSERLDWTMGRLRLNPW